jgi:hypothetical protein
VTTVTLLATWISGVGIRVAVTTLKGIAGFAGGLGLCDRKRDEKRPQADKRSPGMMMIEANAGKGVATQSVQDGSPMTMVQ